MIDNKYKQQSLELLEKICNEVQRDNIKNNSADVKVNVIVNVFSWVKTLFRDDFLFFSKTIHWTECCENQYFFTKNGEFICSWHRNDAKYNECMKPLFAKLGVKVRWIEPTDRKVTKFIKNDLGLHDDII